MKNYNYIFEIVHKISQGFIMKKYHYVYKECMSKSFTELFFISLFFRRMTLHTEFQRRRIP